MEFESTKFDGCYLISPFISKDRRGEFIKTYSEDIYLNRKLPTLWREEYYSISYKNVIRGMHFQLPPHDHEKIVFCTQGNVVDVIVDLRKESKTFKEALVIELNGKKNEGVFIPKGMAHGFLAKTDKVVMTYKVATVYSPDYDAGIRWDSVGVDWKVENPIISERDCKHPLLKDFNSPF
jgi:dTDP-4-dehydrorhamnose 3,5-epimerase